MSIYSTLWWYLGSEKSHNAASFQSRNRLHQQSKWEESKELSANPQAAQLPASSLPESTAKELWGTNTCLGQQQNRTTEENKVAFAAATDLCRQTQLSLFRFSQQTAFLCPSLPLRFALSQKLSHITAVPPFRGWVVVRRLWEQPHNAPGLLPPAQCHH